ncbi:MAG: hypothetical protein P1P90_04115 [Patescibacteria group bacterium]|nr:hypothetical protein [Patescibacteria group bacterium]
MKRKNQQKEHQSSIFFISLLAGVILGVLLLGLITAFFVTDTPGSKYSFTIPNIEKAVSEPGKKSTPFVDHYVNYGGNTARIPVVYCDPIGYEFNSVCSLSTVDQRYIEINLEEHELPLEKIDSIVTNKRTREDKKSKVAYTLWDQDLWSAHIYDLETKETIILNIPKDATMFGAVGTKIDKFSEGGRYIYFHTVGPSSAGKDFIYDTQVQSIVTELNNNYLYEILDLDNENENIIIYLGGCENEDIITEGTDCRDGIYAINTNNGKKMRLDVIENHPNYASMTYPTLANMYYDKVMDVLHVSTGSLAMDYQIKNFSNELKALEGNNIIYTNGDLNFSFEYPNTLTKPSLINFEDIEIELPLHVGAVTSYDKISKQWWDDCGAECYEGGPDTIDVYIYKNPKHLSPKDWVMDDKVKNHIYTNYDDRSQELEEISLGDIKAVKYSWYGLGGADVVVFSDTQNNLIYMLSASYMSEESKIRNDFKIVTDSFELL